MPAIAALRDGKYQRDPVHRRSGHHSRR
jgi:hypothetical protein